MSPRARRPTRSRRLDPRWYGVTVDSEYVIQPVAEPPTQPATPVQPAGDHRWRDGPRGVLGMCGEHEQRCELCPASRRALIPPGWDGVDFPWIYPDGHPAQCPGARGVD
jgi:hypothetical protein